MRQAIVTKYLDPTDQRGARIKAIADAGSKTLGYEHAMSTEDNHEQAAFWLARDQGWVQTLTEFRKKYSGGGMPPATGFANVYVCIN